MPPELNTLRIIWVSFVVSQFIFLGVGLQIRVEMTDPPMLISGVLLAIGLVEAVFAVVGAPVVFKKVVAQSAFIIRFAMCEAVGIFGLVINALGGPIAMAIALHLLAVLTLVLVFPTAERYTAWEVDRA